MILFLFGGDSGTLFRGIKSQALEAERAAAAETAEVVLPPKRMYQKTKSPVFVTIPKGWYLDVHGS